jgi:hypothetical protein
MPPIPMKGRSQVRFSILKSLAAVLVVGVVLAGCGSDDDDDETTGAATTTQTQAADDDALPDELLGTFTRNTTQADIERTAKYRSELGPNQETPLPGPRRIVISGNRLRMISPEEKPPFVVDQEIKATDDGELRFVVYLNPEEGAFCGPEIPQNAVWSWERNGDVLTLKPVQERCADRDSELAGDWKVR